MAIREEAKQAAAELGDAINDAVACSNRVTSAIQRLRDIGFEPHLSIKLEIGLEKFTDASDPLIVPEFSDDDLRTLRSMHIKA
jgi:hypothetical protein